MVPAYAIGGDFYDFLQLSDHAVLVILGDVSGKATHRDFVLPVSHVDRWTNEWRAHDEHADAQ